MTRPHINRLASGLDDETEEAYLERLRMADGYPPEGAFGEYSYELPESLDGPYPWMVGGQIDGTAMFARREELCALIDGVTQGMVYGPERTSWLWVHYRPWMQELWQIDFEIAQYTD